MKLKPFKCVSCNETREHLFPRMGGTKRHKSKCKACRNIEELKKYHETKVDKKEKIIKYRENSRLAVKKIVESETFEIGLTKFCHTCKCIKEHTAFNKNRTQRSGLETMCRECKNVYRRASYAKDPEHYRQIALRYYHKDPIKRSKTQRESIKKKEYQEKLNLYNTLFLSTPYVNKMVANLFPNLKASDIPEEITKAYRRTIELKRISENV